MKVLFVDQTGQLGGGELSLLDIVRGTGHSCEVALFSDGPFRGMLEQIPVPVHLLSEGATAGVRREGGLSSLLSAAPSLVRLRNSLARLADNFDVLYANSQKAFVLSALARNSKQKLIWHLRDMLSAEHFSSFMRRIAVFAGNHTADLIIANSAATCESLQLSGNRNPSVTVIYNGIHPEPFDRVQDSEIRALRSELGWQGKFVVGAFGRLSPWKGQHILLEAASTLPDLHIAVVGDALFGEDDYAHSLRQLVMTHHLEQRVQFLGFRKDIPLLMRSVDVVAHTAVAPEPFGRILVEGMLASRPVIASRAGGALEILRDQDTGLLVPPRDVPALRNAIDSLRRDPSLAWNLAERGRRWAMRHFTVSNMNQAVDRAIASEAVSLGRPSQAT
jgi:glycosyltransferase involved in cell wall biosynthesis